MNKDIKKGIKKVLFWDTLFTTAIELSQIMDGVDEELDELFKGTKKEYKQIEKLLSKHVEKK